MLSRRIVCTPDTCSGEPRIEGTRISCELAVAIISNAGQNIEKPQIEEFLHLYPELTAADAKTALRYCAERRCMKDESRTSYCTGCALNETPEVLPTYFLDESGKGIWMRPGANPERKDYYPGTYKEYLAERAPKEYWLIAQAVLDATCTD